MNERLKQLRKELGLTQQEFADALKVKRTTIANYEIGRNEPIDAVISLICTQFDVNENWLRTGEGQMFVERTKDEELAMLVGKLLADEEDSFKKRFTTALLKLDETEWKTVEKIAEEITKG